MALSDFARALPSLTPTYAAESAHAALTSSPLSALSMSSRVSFTP